MIVEYQQADGSSKLFGYMMSDGPISAATGAMVRGFHSKCYWIAKKREARGDAVTGRVLAGPTGYDIDQVALSRDDIAALGITPEEAMRRGTGQLSARLARLREVAEQIGKGVGDPQVQEAFAAHERGGPYSHHHMHRLDTYQLLAHLKYAHGLDDPDDFLARPHDTHAWHHAQLAQSAAVADRDAHDEPDPRTTDWREQHTAVLE